MRHRPLALAVSILVLLAGCGDPPPPEPADAGTGDATGLPDGLFLAAAPDGPVGVTDAKKSAQEGDEVVLRGRVAGTKHPFVDGRAALTLADMDAVTPCNVNPEDGCQTPWDACCDTPAELVAGTATIEVVGADGKPLAVGLKGAGGIEELSVLVVRGKVARRPDDQVLIVHATGIHVEK